MDIFLKGAKWKFMKQDEQSRQTKMSPWHSIVTHATKLKNGLSLPA
jgi:hypothetical protein